MSRYHWWGFIVNEAGEPIENAEITVKLAGKEDLANIYYDEFGNANSTDNPALSAGPQLSTLSNGYYEFWIGDNTEVYGYSNEQKFTLEWIRLGVAHGKIEYINIFPLGPQTYPMSLDGCVNPSQEYNKLMSDYYACKWDFHVESEVILPSGEFSSIHGLELIVTDELDVRPNKIVTNNLGWHWEHHRLATVQNPAPTEVGGIDTGLDNEGRPHGMEEVNPLDGTDTTRNKLVSNVDLYNLQSNIDNLSVVVNEGDVLLNARIDDLTDVTETSKSGWWEIHGDEWVYDVWDKWYVIIAHDLDIYFPLVQVSEVTVAGVPAGKLLSVESIEYLDTNSVKITIENEDTPNDPNLNCIVRIANGGIHRHPENEVIGGGVNEEQN